MEVEETTDLYKYDRLWGNMRWLVLGLFLLFSIIPHEGIVVSLVPFYFLLGAGFLLNIFFHYLIPRKFITKKKIIVESVLDIGAISLLMWLTGGHSSPFFFIYFLIVFGIASIFDTKVTFIQTTVMSLAYIAVFILEKGHAFRLLPEFYEHFTHILTTLASLWLIAYFSSYLAHIFRDLLQKQKYLSAKNEELYQKEARARTNLAAIHDISRVISSSLDITKTYSILAKKLRKIINFDRISVSIFDRTHKNVESYVISRTGKVLEERKIKPKEVCCASWVDKHKKSLIRSDIKNSPQFHEDHIISSQGIKTCLSLPLMVKNRVLGTFCFYNKKKAAYTAADVRSLEPIVEALSIAVENFKLYRELNQQAIKDSLTGVYNRSYFYHFLKRELAQAKRYRRKVSVVMLDLDGFKAYNDTYGHQNGDQVLKKVAGILTKSMRHIDIVARYGGDEFVLLLTGADKRTASLVMARLEEKIEKQKIKNGDEGKTFLTASVGIACYPDDATTYNELIHIADILLYNDKYKKVVRLDKDISAPVSLLPRKEMNKPKLAK